MTWIMKVDGQEVSSDDFTLAELERVEKDSDTPWSVANPLRSAAVARAFLKIALIKVGRDPVDVETWTLRRLKTAFDYRADEDVDEVDGEEQLELPLDGSTQGSSSTARSGTGGHRKKRADSA